MPCWAATCSVCGKVKYPWLATQPGPEWVCALCRVAASETRQARQRAGRRGAASRRLQQAERNAEGAI